MIGIIGFGRFGRLTAINLAKDFEVIVYASEWPLVAIKENDNKILVSGDSNFCDDQYIKRAHNRVFCNNIVSWINGGY